MDSQKTSVEYKDKFILSFVEMVWAGLNMIDPRCKDWTGGRMEIHTYESEFAIDEESFATPYAKEWKDFQEFYDLKWVDKDELEKVIKTLKEKFYRIDKNGNPIL